jgi:predicted dehydrogenase
LGAEVREVIGNLATHIRERKDESGRVREVTTDDEANLLVRFEDTEFTEGATGTASMSLVEPGKPEHRLELFGELGALMIEESGELWQAKVGEGEWRPVETDRGELAPGMRDGGWARGFTAFSKQIVEALREGRTTVADAATFEDGYRTQLVLDAARRANESGCWAEI